jgi:hypothetical protein
MVRRREEVDERLRMNEIFSLFSTTELDNIFCFISKSDISNFSSIKVI